jgi:hypothetical protein
VWRLRGRHAASRLRSLSEARARRESTAARFRWIIALGVFFALVAVILASGLGKKQAVLSSSNAPNAPPHGSWLPKQSDVAQGPSRRPSPEPKPHTAVPTPSPSRAPAPAPAAKATPSPAHGPVPVATAENETPTGTNELAWSEAVLRALGAPLLDENIESMGYWMQNEAGSPPFGIVGANNPINVSEPGYGGTRIRKEGGGYYLYSYPTVQDGINATVAYLSNGSYGGILLALKAGTGLSSSSLASEFSTYSGGSYRMVPDPWGSSQGTPKT